MSFSLFPAGHGPDDLARERRHLALAVAALAFMFYAACAAPTVSYGGDCGELIAASYRLGIAHPTGYPLYLLLGRTFASLFPFGEIGLRYNLLSSLCGAVGVGLIVAIVHRLVSRGEFGKAYSAAGDRAFRLLAAGGAGALLAGFFYYSSQSVIAEVYALNGVMLAALLYCAIAWHQSGWDDNGEPLTGPAASGDVRWVYACGALAGLALNAHLSCAFLAPGLLLYVFRQHRARFRALGGLPRHLLRTGLLFLAAYALTLYLPLRASLFPPLPPGSVEHSGWWPLNWTDPSTPKAWLTHITAQQYKHLMWAPYEITLGGRTFQFSWFVQPLNETISKAGAFSLFVLIQLFWCVPMAFVGAYTCWANGASARRAGGGRWLGLLLGSAALLNVGLQINYTVGDLRNFFYPAYIVMAIWLGLGIARASTYILNKIPPREARRGAVTPRQRVAALFALWVLSACAMQWTTAGPMLNQRGDTTARDVALERAKAVEKLAAATGRTPNVVLMTDDALFTFWYVRHVLGRAANCNTPWGHYRNKSVEAGRLFELTERWRTTGPVVLTKWDDAIDRKYPYVMLTESGDLCLASDRVLPPPAEVLPGRQPLSPQWKVNRAGFRATRRSAPANNLVAGEAEQAAKPGRNGKARPPITVARGDMSVFDLEFSAGAARPLAPREAKAPTVDAKHGAMHIGYLEVFMARQGRFSEIRPDQGEVREKSALAPPVVAFRQSRRLIVPAALSAQSTANLVMKASFPLQIDVESINDRYNVWVRLVKGSDDINTPWQRIDDVIIG